MVLPQPQAVGVAGRDVADVQPDAAEGRDLRHLPLGQEAVGDPALVEHLDRPRVQPARPRAGKVLVRAPLDDRHVDPRERQLPRQHQPRRAAADDHHRML